MTRTGTRMSSRWSFASSYSTLSILFSEMPTFVAPHTSSTTLARKPPSCFSTRAPWSVAAFTAVLITCGSKPRRVAANSVSLAWSTWISENTRLRVSERKMSSFSQSTSNASTSRACSSTDSVGPSGLTARSSASSSATPRAASTNSSASVGATATSFTSLVCSSNQWRAFIPSLATCTRDRVKGTHLAEEYQRQGRWRRWDQIFELVPFREGERVLDLGCGVGDVAGRLQRVGLQVVGIDANEELLREARLRHPSVRFEKLDVTELAPDTFGRVDGIWASFVAAYFTNLDEALSQWRDCLVPGGWVALVEVDDLLGHTPMPIEMAGQVRAFYDEARTAGRYDFECGRRLGRAMESAGLRVLTEQ